MLSVLFGFKQNLIDRAIKASNGTGLCGSTFSQVKYLKIRSCPSESIEEEEEDLKCMSCLLSFVCHRIATYIDDVKTSPFRHPVLVILIVSQPVQWGPELIVDSNRSFQKSAPTGIYDPFTFSTGLSPR